MYGDDPVAVARRWQAAGAQRIHVVDLDGAKAGQPRQLDVVRRIVAAVDVPIQLGGGLRTVEHAEAALDEGVDRVILGTAALEDRQVLVAALSRYGARIAVGIDARDGQVAVRGWVDLSSVDAYGFARALASLGVGTIVFTDIGVDGTLAGPNLPAMRRMARTVPEISVLASGGVGALLHVLALAATGAAGVIVGKALYAGTLDLAEAIQAVDALAPAGSAP